jgi:hypothetical protein
MYNQQSTINELSNIYVWVETGKICHNFHSHCFPCLAAYVLPFHYWLKCTVERLFVCSFFLGEVCNALIIIDHAEERLMAAED